MDRRSIILLFAVITLLHDSECASADIAPKLLYGTESGSMYSCNLDKPENCVHFNGAGNPIKSMAISGEFVYVGLAAGIMWRCPIHQAHSCTVLNRAKTIMNAVAVSSDYAFGAINDGILWRCQLNEPDSCHTFYESPSPIISMAASDEYLIIGLDDGQMMSCLLNKKDSCDMINKAEVPINALAVSKKYIYAGLATGEMWRCDIEEAQSCSQFNKATTAILSIDVLGDYIYAGLYTGELWKCDIEKRHSCVVVKKFQDKLLSIATTYRTVNMDSYFKGESESCIWQERSQCIPPVNYYNIKQRAVFELSVKNGRLYDSLGNLFDTSNADESHSGKKAIFVMDPRGRIYASNRHPNYLIHDSSFLSGNPVSAAGELEVEQGVIKSITSCSGHYIPSKELTSQVVTALAFKGYEGNVTVTDCKKCKLVLDAHFNKIG